MLFNSAQFLIFFPLVTALYFLVPHRMRWLLLLAASCFFYMAFVPEYILILGFTIVIDYAAGIVIANSQGARRKQWLVASLVANIGVLVLFKYFNFIGDIVSTTVNALMGGRVVDIALSIVLPIGLSFHTFQSMSYTIEVYRGRQTAEHHFGIYALYVMFYPQLVAGPIERPQHMLHQFRERHTFDYPRVRDGLQLMAWGMFKKVVIADRLAIAVNQVFGHYLSYDGPTFGLATIFFAFQIFCDFSGYSDIAIGSAQVMGFTLMQNFRRPYHARSIADFWTRWHISLSSWFRDYLYIPLGGNRVAKWRWQLNLLIVFLVSGLWHGAQWTFVAWGALHGFYLLAGIWLAPLTGRLTKLTGLDRIPRLRVDLQILITFMLVCYAWIFFRADGISQALYISAHLFSGYDTLNDPLKWQKHYHGFRRRARNLSVARFDCAAGGGTPAADPRQYPAEAGRSAGLGALADLLRGYCGARRAGGFCPAINLYLLPVLMKAGESEGRARAHADSLCCSCCCRLPLPRRASIRPMTVRARTGTPAAMSWNWRDGSWRARSSRLKTTRRKTTIGGCCARTMRRCRESVQSPMSWCWVRVIRPMSAANHFQAARS